ncbi:MAG: MmcQ/YjbR family DNA-binding protein [Aeromicrobium sp.]
MVTTEDVRRLASTLPRSYEVLVRDRVKFRVGSIVWLAFSRDETILGFAFPKEEREALVESDPKTYLMPPESDLRFNWVMLRLDRIDAKEMREIVLDAWRMVVPKFAYRAYLESQQGIDSDTLADDAPSDPGDPAE